MNKFLLSACLIGAGACLSHAAIELNFYNSFADVEGSLTFKNEAGTTFVGSGVVAAGWFDDDVHFSQILSVREQFKQFWTWNAETEAGSDYSYFNSVNEFAVAGTADTYGAAAGKTLYAFIGSGTSVADSAEFALLSFKDAENVALSFASESVEIALADNAWLSENELLNWTLEVGTLQGTDTVLFAAIPEPSAFGLLAGLGALALAGARRRRELKD